MSLVATCPSCDTMFRVVADQLKLHNGKVRCGACGHIFNAAERIAFVPDEALTSRRAIPPIASSIPNSVQMPSATETSKNWASKDISPLISPDTDSPDGSTQADDSEAESLLISEEKLESGPSPDEVADLTEPPHLAAAFLARESKKIRATRLMIRFASWGCILALLGLLMQAGYWWRNELAVALPATRPWLVEACESLKCKIDLPAHADQLILDTLQISQAQHSKHFQVRATMRNLSQLPQRAPHLELTLTSENGAPVIRRVLLPREWLPTTTVLKGLAPTSELPVEFTVAVELPFTGFTGRLLFASDAAPGTQKAVPAIAPITVN